MTKNQRRNCVLVAAAFLSLEQIAHASTWTGNGADNNFQTAANWDVAAAPGAVLGFAGTNKLNPNNDFPAATSFGGINFLTGAGAFTLNGNNIVLTGPVTVNAANGNVQTF